MIRKGLDSRYRLSHYENDPTNFIELDVTQDEKWSHHFDPESKMQSKQWKHPGSPSPKKFKRNHSAGKVMASIFWDSQGVIMIEYLEQDRMINDAYHAGDFRQLRQEIARKRRDSRCSAIAGRRPAAYTSQVAITAATE